MLQSLSLARLGHSTDSAAEELQTSTLLVKCPDAKVCEWLMKTEPGRQPLSRFTFGQD